MDVNGMFTWWAPHPVPSLFHTRRDISIENCLGLKKACFDPLSASVTVTRSWKVSHCRPLEELRFSYDTWNTWRCLRSRNCHQTILFVHWLVVSTPLKNISPLGWLFPIYGNKKWQPNHQPVHVCQQKSDFSQKISLTHGSCEVVTAGKKAMKLWNQHLHEISGRTHGIQTPVGVISSVQILVRTLSWGPRNWGFWSNEFFLG